MQISKIATMTFSPTVLALVSVLTIGYLAAIGLGTWAYFANEKNN